MIERITPQWLAGFFDGEGCVSIYTIKPSTPFGQLNVEIAQNDKGLLSAIQLLYPEFRLRQPRKSAACWQLKAVGTSAKRFLADIYPHSIRKREQIGLALDFIETLVVHTQRRESCPKEKLAYRQALHEKLLESRQRDSIVIQ